VAGFNVKIYVVGIFVEKSETTVKILDLFKAKPEGLFDALLSTEDGCFFPRALHMTFCRGVTGKQVVPFKHLHFMSLFYSTLVMY
jgi:hypothetical protein